MITTPSCYIIWRVRQRTTTIVRITNYATSVPLKTWKTTISMSAGCLRLSPLPQGPRPLLPPSQGKWSSRCFLECCGGWKIDFLASLGANTVSWKLCHVDCSPYACLKETLHWLGRRYMSIWNYFGSSVYSCFQIKESSFKYQKIDFSMIQSPMWKIPKAVLFISSQMCSLMSPNNKTILFWWKVWWFVEIILNCYSVFLIGMHGVGSMHR